MATLFGTPAFADVATGLADFRHGRFAEAYQAWIAAEQAGDARAARYLGVMYDTGEGVRQDRSQAVRWYRVAAGLGDPAAMFNVGVAYDSGTGIRRDPQEAARWYRRAAARHFGRADYDLALMYRSGDGVPRSTIEATRFFRAAAQDGISAANAHLPQTVSARMQPEPRDESHRLVTHVVPNDDAAFLQAQRALLSRQPQETADAISLFRQAASEGGPAAALALYDLGWCYENGVGVSTNRSQAYALYIRAAAETDDHGLRDLAEAGAVALRTAPADTVAGR